MIKGSHITEEHRRKISEANKGKICSEETKQKLREANKGKIYSEEWKKEMGSFVKEHKVSKETRQKISESNRRRIVSSETRFKMSESHKGQISWNKGKHLSDETRRKLSEANKGKKLSEETKKKIGQSEIGENHWNWKGGISSLAEKIRKCFKYRQWRSDVSTRDNFTCQECRERGRKLYAHHIKSFSSILQYYEITTLEEALDCEKIWDINNGITLCKKCHKKTENYGGQSNKNALHKKRRQVCQQKN